MWCNLPSFAGAAQAGVTDLAAVKKVLLDTHGTEIRNAKQQG